MKTKKMLLPWLIVSGILIVLLSSCSSSSGTGEDNQNNSQNAATNENDNSEETESVTLTMADFFPAAHDIGEQVTQGWADEVEEATDGAVEIEVYPGESLVESDDTLDGVISDVADIGQTSVAYNIGRFPILGALYLGGIEYKNSKVSSYVVRDIIEEYGDEELGDVKVLFAYGITPGGLQTTKPIETLDDIKGMEIRATGNGTENLEALGGVPVEMPQSEAYEAIKKGVVKGNLAPAEVLEGWNTAEVTNYVTETDFLFNSIHMYIMNKDVWESLPEEVQDEIDKVSDDMFEDIASEMFINLNESGMEFAKEHDVEVIELDDDEKEKWLEKLEPIQEDYIEKLDEEGLPGQEIMDRINELADKYNEEL